MQTIFFPSGNETIAGNLLIAGSTKSPGMLILHGGGKGNKERFLDVQYTLFDKGISSLAIDFRGVGQSSGMFAEGSLVNRFQDAKAALQELKKYASSVGILGSSMGGFIAALLAPDVHLLVLSSPAAYGITSEDKILGESFTQEITKPHSWETSRSFNSLSNWHGKLLVLYGEFDTTIPDGVKQRYKEIADMINGTYVAIPGGEHSLIMPKTESGKRERNTVLEIISTFVKENL